MPALEFLFDPADIPRLARWPGLRASRTFPAEITWFDTADADLANEDLVLSVRGRGCQLTRLRPSTALEPPPVLAKAARPELLDRSLPIKLAPQTRLHGKQQTFRRIENDAEPLQLRLIEGQLDSPSRPTLCRLVLEGPASTLTILAIDLAGSLNVQVPRWGLAEQALAAARGEPPKPRALGAPQVPDGRPVSESLTTITGHLADVMLHWADRIPPSRPPASRPPASRPSASRNVSHTPEPVHQMRVATRRLRSALSVYKDVAACPELAGLVVPLKLCAARLGAARDWDVFLGGIGERLAKTFPDHPGCNAMLRAATRRRRAAYTELRGFIASPDFRTLMTALACASTLRPWEASAPAPGLQQDTATFAAAVMAKRFHAVRKAGREIQTLSIPALHELRKKCKRLRYAAEFFAPLFHHKRTRRFVDRLAGLQEELGLLNDTAAVSGLMAQLGRLERSYAAGLVEGFSAAGAAPARTRIHHAWKRFRQAPQFWS